MGWDGMGCKGEVLWQVVLGLGVVGGAECGGLMLLRSWRLRFYN